MACTEGKSSRTAALVLSDKWKARALTIFRRGYSLDSLRKEYLKLVGQVFRHFLVRGYRVLTPFRGGGSVGEWNLFAPGEDRAG